MNNTSLLIEFPEIEALIKWMIDINIYKFIVDRRDFGAGSYSSRVKNVTRPAADNPCRLRPKARKVLWRRIHREAASALAQGPPGWVAKQPRGQNGKFTEKTPE